MQQEKKESQEVQVYEIKKFNMIKAPFKNNQVEHVLIKISKLRKKYIEVNKPKNQINTRVQNSFTRILSF